MHMVFGGQHISPVLMIQEDDSKHEIVHAFHCTALPIWKSSHQTCIFCICLIFWLHLLSNFTNFHPQSFCFICNVSTQILFSTTLPGSLFSFPVLPMFSGKVLVTSCLAFHLPDCITLSTSRCSNCLTSGDFIIAGKHFDGKCRAVAHVRSFAQLHQHILAVNDPKFETSSRSKQFLCFIRQTFSLIVLLAQHSVLTPSILNRSCYCPKCSADVSPVRRICICHHNLHMC